MSRKAKKLRACRTLLLGVFALGIASQAHAATAFTYQGELKQAGQPATGRYDLGFCLFDTPDPATLVPLGCVAIQDDVPVSAGRFTVALDFGAAFAGEPRFLEVRVRDGASSGGFTTLSPRQAVTPSPQALHAQRAAVAPWSGLSGVPAGFADGSDDAGSGTLTAVSAGFGLSGGTITTSGTLAVDPSAVQRRISGDCAAGSYVRVIAEDGTVICGSDADSGGSVTSVGSGAGLQGGPIVDSGTLAVDFSMVQARIVVGCAAGQVLRAVNADGSVVCDAVPGPVRLAVLDDTDNDLGNAIAAASGASAFPGIAHYDATAGAVRFVRCNDYFCQGGNEFVNVVDDTGNVGGDIALSISSGGAPVLAYFDIDSGAIRLARCNDSRCAGGNEAINTLAGSGMAVVSAYSVAMVLRFGSQPLIAYQDRTSGSVVVARCNDDFCAGSDETITVLDTPAGGISLALGLDGNPVLAYCKSDPNDGSSELWLAKCNDTACSGGGETLTLLDDRPTSACAATAIAVPADGLPVIAYEGNSAIGVRVVKCNDAACTGADESRVLADGSMATGFFGIDMVLGPEGHPMIVVRGLLNPQSSPRFIHCGNADCSVGNAISLLDQSVNLKYGPAVMVGRDGFPMVVYSGYGANALQLAKCETSTCL